MNNFFVVMEKYAIWLILALTTILFYQGLNGEFVRDDWPVIADNLTLSKIESLPNYFVSSVWASTQEQNSNFLYRPMFWIVTWINYQFWGSDPWGFHLLGLGLYLLNIVLVKQVATKVFFPNNSLAATLATLVFALYPIHVESVSWISGYTDLMLGCFLLSSFLLYRKYQESHQLLVLIGSLLLFGAGLLSKEVAATFPFLLLAHDLLLKRKIFIGRMAAFVAVLVLYFVVRHFALDGGASLGRFSAEYWQRAFEFYFTYVQVAFMPWPLEVFYQNPDRGWSVLLGVLIALVTFAIFWRLRKQQQPIFLFAVCWFILTIAPALSLALLETPTFAGRFLYLPSIPIAIGYGWVLSWLASKNYKYSTAVIVTFVSTLLVTSWFYTMNWRNDQSFYLSAIKAEPKVTSLYVSLAKYYSRMGNDVGLHSLPKYIPANLSQEFKIDVLESIANELGQQGDSNNSQWYFNQIIALDNSFAMAWMGLGNVAWQQQQLTKALDYYLTAYQHQRTSYELCYNLALLYRQLGNFNQAKRFQVAADKLRSSSLALKG